MGGVRGGSIIVLREMASNALAGQESNKYEQYLRRKQSPPASNRIQSRINEIEEKYYPPIPSEETDSSPSPLLLLELKSKVEDLQQKLSSEKNLNIVK